MDEDEPWNVPEGMLAETKVVHLEHKETLASSVDIIE